MGYDISYHPIHEKEMQDWYFNIDFTRIVENDHQELEQLGQAHNIDAFYVQKYKDTLNVAVNTKPDEPFELTHGYYMAVVQGFFRKYFYIRGGAFTFLLEEKPHFRQYTKPWQEMLIHRYENPISNQLNGNYSSGVYIPAEKVVQLLQDYQNNPAIKEDLDNFFSHNRIQVFLKALNAAKETNSGLLEATEVVEPNPLDLNASTCYSNLFNCDPEGAHLYQEAAMEQMKEIEAREKLPEGEILKKATYNVINHERVEQPQKEKKSFWKRLFG